MTGPETCIGTRVQIEGLDHVMPERALALAKEVHVADFDSVQSGVQSLGWDTNSTILYHLELVDARRCRDSLQPDRTESQHLAR